MLMWNLSLAYRPECPQAWRSRAGKVSESVVGENCATWMCSWFQCLSSLSGLMLPIDVVVSCSIWSLTHPFEEKRWMGRVPFAWETISNNSLGSTDTLGASTGWDIYLTITACGVGLPQYAPVCPSMPQWNLSAVYWPECHQSLEVEGRERLDATNRCSRKLQYLIPYTSVWRETMNGQSAFCLGNDFKQRHWLNRRFGSIHRLRYISDDSCLWCWIAPVCPSMPQYAPVKLKRCLLTWMSTSLEVEGRESQWASGWWKLWHMDVLVVPTLE